MIAALVIFVVAFARPAAAEEFFMPLSIGAAVTEVRIVNRSDESLTVTIEILDSLSSIGKTTSMTLADHEMTQWSEAGHVQFGALAIKANGPILVGAMRRSATLSAISTVPVLDADHAIDEGTITIGSRKGDATWAHGIAVVNPDAIGALLIVSIHRREHVVEVASLYVSGRTARVASLDDLFGTSELSAGDRLNLLARQSLLLFGYDVNAQTGAHFFTAAAPSATAPAKRRAARHGSPPPSVQTVMLTPSKDNTLYQTSNGSLSNGSGVHLFAGATNRRELRRALLAFDLASQIPPGSRITQASLMLAISRPDRAPSR